MSLVPEPSPFRVPGLRDGGLHPFPTLDAEPGERADLGAELDRLGLGEVAGVCFLAFAWVGCGMLRRVSLFRTTTLPPAQQILQERHAARLTLRGRRDVTGGGRRRSPASAADAQGLPGPAPGDGHDDLPEVLLL